MNYHQASGDVLHCLPLGTDQPTALFLDNQGRIYTTTATGNIILCHIKNQKLVTLGHLEIPVNHHFQSCLTPDQFLVSQDTQSHALATYQVEEGQLKKLSQLDISHHTYPTQLLFHPIYKAAFLLAGSHSAVDVLFYDGFGEFEFYETHTSFPTNPKIQTADATLVISNDGRFLYTINEHYTEISTFLLHGDAKLKLIEIQKTGGKRPTHCIIIPDQNYLIITHKDSDNVSVFRRNLKTGLLSLVSNNFSLPESTSINFEQKTW